MKDQFDRKAADFPEEMPNILEPEVEVEEERLARDTGNKTVKDQFGSLTVLCKERPDLVSRMAGPPDAVTEDLPFRVQPGKPEMVLVANPVAEETFPPGQEMCRVIFEQVGKFYLLERRQPSGHQAAAFSLVPGIIIMQEKPAILLVLLHHRDDPVAAHDA